MRQLRNLSAHVSARNYNDAMHSANILEATRTLQTLTAEAASNNRALYAENHKAMSLARNFTADKHSNVAPLLNIPLLLRHRGLEAGWRRRLGGLAVFAGDGVGQVLLPSSRQRLLERQGRRLGAGDDDGGVGHLQWQQQQACTTEAS